MVGHSFLVWISATILEKLHISYKSQKKIADHGFSHESLLSLLHSYVTPTASDCISSWFVSTYAQRRTWNVRFAFQQWPPVKKGNKHQNKNKKIVSSQPRDSSAGLIPRCRQWDRSPKAQAEAKSIDGRATSLSEDNFRHHVVRVELFNNKRMVAHSDDSSLNFVQTVLAVVIQ